MSEKETERDDHEHAAGARVITEPAPRFLIRPIYFGKAGKNKHGISLLSRTAVNQPDDSQYIFDYSLLYLLILFQI